MSQVFHTKQLSFAKQAKDKSAEQTKLTPEQKKTQCCLIELQFNLFYDTATSDDIQYMQCNYYNKMKHLYIMIQKVQK